jgi:hypothetical protein
VPACQALLDPKAAVWGWVSARVDKVNARLKRQGSAFIENFVSRRDNNLRGVDIERISHGLSYLRERCEYRSKNLEVKHIQDPKSIELR